MNLNEKTKVLNEALPYIKKYHKKIVIIKLGGRILTDMKHIMDDVALLKHIGMKPIVVHGGGPIINDEMKKAKINPKFINGLRYTDKKTINVVKKVFSKINNGLVKKIKSHKAKSINLKKTIIVKKKDSKLGFVGEITNINKKKITKLLNKDYIPVISPLGIGQGNKEYNINADTVASHMAVKLKAEKLTILTNVNGIIIKGKLQSHVDFNTANREIASGIINTGMVPKVKACMHAVKNKCPKAHLINGLTPHSLLLEIFTDKGIGTEIVYKNGS